MNVDFNDDYKKSLLNKNNSKRKEVKRNLATISACMFDFRWKRTSLQSVTSEIRTNKGSQSFMKATKKLREEE